MRSTCLVLFFLVVSAGAAAEPKPASAAEHDKFRWSDLFGRSFQKSPRIHLSVITEMTEEGKKRQPGSPEHPIYYALLDGGLLKEGLPVAGDKAPKPEQLAAILRNSLAGSGMQPESVAHPAGVLIFYRWGSYNHVMSFSGVSDPNADPDVLDTSDPLQMKNLAMRAAVVGGPKFADKLMAAFNEHRLEFFEAKDEKTEMLVSMSLSDLYFLVAIGLDAPAAVQGRKIKLWTTQISTDSNGLVMEDTLPALVTGARSYFGRETNGPVLFHPRLYEGRVEIGEPTVNGYIENPPSPAPKNAAPSK